MTIRTADLYSIASSGIRANTKLLETTGHNISNVNTEGYVRETTEFRSQLTGGVGRGETSRVLDIFTQNQLRRDTSSFAEAETFFNRLSRLDDVLGSEANSLSSSMSRVFDAIQTAVDEPSNVASRNLVLGEMETFLSQANRLDSFMSQTEKELNLEMDSVVREANDLIKNIADLNQQIRDTRAANRYEEPGTLLNERDKAVDKLAEIMSIETRRLADDTTAINLSTGESLVLEDGSFNILQMAGDPDVSRRTLQLNVADKGTSLNVAETQLGGKMGALYRFRDDVLAVTQRELGQMTLGFADAMNEQNNLGMDLDGQLGSDIFTLPVVQGLSFRDNNDPTASINARIIDGEATNLTDRDYQVTLDVDNGASFDVTIEVLNPDGSAVLDTAGNPITFTDTITKGPGNFSGSVDGLEFELPNTGNYAVDDQFLVRPTKNIVEDVGMAIIRGEDLAFASPIKVESGADNLGSAVVKSTDVTNTSLDTAGTEQSGFNETANVFSIDAPGQAPGTAVGAPAEIRFTAADSYEVYDSAGTLVTTVTGASNLNNLIDQARTTGAGPAWPYDATQTDYPGYDLSMEGVPKAGDTFTIGYNAEGVKDNRNGLELADIQNTSIIRQDASRPFDQDLNGTSFHGDYADMVSTVGEKTSSADIKRKATEALFRQSEDNFQAVSGVNLDEEAANLVRFQQAYAASARILSAAQSTFDAILNSVR
ncbi:Flagellar hook-associated protein [Saliniradius amylolyticus]|uniref:Flagellar hook-associated protein 1 n=1 Tax=Saliniradius amylolyticus TaxID=2183582 RepID=A0A2S2E4I6_9ALTE|nr:flagellar hook-associated protein FlgK [Saliniradius amylolyticus]AWL12571.1 Flagellar hook-associated protein [Saliniradius amylolyticus]